MNGDRAKLVNGPVTGTLEALMLIPTIALSISLVPFIGQNIGSGRLDSVKRAVNIS